MPTPQDDEWEYSTPDANDSDWEVNTAAPTHNQQAWQDLNKNLENVPGLMTAGHMYQQFLKGMPIIGRFMNADLPGNKEFENDHPIATGASRFAGAVASTAPLSAAMMLPEASAATRILTNSPTGSSVIPNAIIQSQLFGGLSAGDKAAENYEKGGMDAVKNDNYKSAYGWGAAGGALGPLLGKLISPNAVALPEKYVAPPAHKFDLSEGMLPPDRTEFLNRHLGLPSEEGRKAIMDAINNDRARNYAADVAGVKAAANEGTSKLSDAVSALGAGALGYLTHGVEGLIGGVVAGPYANHAAKMIAPKVYEKTAQAIPKMVAAARGNQLMASPINQAILGSILGESANSATQN